jgi:hypothetical protein
VLFKVGSLDPCMRETHKEENDIRAGSAVHADGDAILDQHADELGAGELANLIGVEDVRRAVFR